MRKNSVKRLFTKKRTPIAELGGLRGIIGFVFLVSGIVNLLALTGSFYMLQIYDRTLTSQSVPTLLALSALAIGLYMFQGLLDVSRSQILVRLGAKLDAQLAPLAHKVAIDMPRYGFSTAEVDRARPRRRYAAAASRRPGPDGAVRPAVDAAVSRFRLLPAPLSGDTDLLPVHWCSPGSRSSPRS